MTPDKAAKPGQDPAEPVRWGILGCGSIATHAICPAIRWSKLARLVAVASRDHATAQVKAREVQAEKSYGSYQELLEDPEIEAVYIGTPNGLHEEWTLKAAKAGKHVLCDKSLSLTTSATRRMVDACDGAGVRLMEAYMYRHHPQWDVVRTAIEDGKIGEVRLVRAGLYGSLQNTNDHRWSANLGGGALYDLTCYGANLARMLFRREPISILANADRQTREQVDRTSVGILDFGHGRLAVISGSLSCFTHQYCEIEGTHGRISVRYPFIPGWEKTVVEILFGMNNERVEIPGANHFLHQVEHFCLCVRQPQRALTPAENGLMQSFVNEAIEQAWLAERSVEVAEP